MDRVLITMDDLETAVRTNAAFEQAGLLTVMVAPTDEVVAVLSQSEPDIVVLTGALHEGPAGLLIEHARDRSISTLGLVEAEDPDPQYLARHVGLPGWRAKPAEPADVVRAAQRLLARRRLQERTGIIGESPAIQEVLVKIEQMAPVTSTLLIEGESGTGKELVAQAIHQLSPRRDKPFIAVSCSALPETLLESELFGHEKGSFTGAAERRLGRFERADQGTLLLDGVGEMPLAPQVKLLRVLESRSFFRVGGVQPIHVDVRVIAATNRSLKEEVALGQFRDDLFYRLNVLSIYLPPLRERKSDVQRLIRRFIRELSREHGRSFPGITPDAMDVLVNAHWPGNVRQLRNLIESMVVLSPGREIQASDIPQDVQEGGTRLLPVRVPGASQDVAGRELEFIFRSLVELKLQLEDLRRRVDEAPGPVEVVDVGRRRVYTDIVEGTAVGVEGDEDGARGGEAGGTAATVLYRSGMKMAEVERGAIEAALKERRGNRRSEENTSQL